MRKFAALVLIAAAPAHAEAPDSLLAQVLADAADGPVYAYDMTFETPDITASGYVDPTAEVGSRVTVNSPAKADWPKDFAKSIQQMEKDVDGNIWCAQYAESIPADAQLIETSETTARYAFDPVADPEDQDQANFIKHVTGTAVIDKLNPAILSFELSAPKPFKPAVIAKVNTFKMTVTCNRGPDGRTYASEMNMHVAGSAMMKSFEQKFSRKITALHPPQ